MSAPNIDLGLEMIERDGVIFGGFNHAMEMLDADAIERYTGCFRQFEIDGAWTTRRSSIGCPS